MDDPWILKMHLPYDEELDYIPFESFRKKAPKATEGNENMEKKFAVMLPANLKFKTYEDAEKEAKRFTSTNGGEYAIMQAVAVTVQPVPAIEVMKF